MLIRPIDKSLYIKQNKHAEREANLTAEPILSSSVIVKGSASVLLLVLDTISQNFVVVGLLSEYNNTFFLKKKTLIVRKF